MRVIFDACCGTMMQNLRDRKSLVIMLLFPIVLTLILGTALGKVVGGGNTVESLHVKAAIINHDRGPAARSMIGFFQSEKIKKIVNSRDYKTEKRAKADLKNQKLDAIIVIPDGFSSRVAGGRPARIDFVTSGDLESTVVKSLADSYLKRVSAIQSAAEMGASPQKEAAVHLDSLIADHAFSTKGKVPKAIDYYAVTMLIMIILYGYHYGNEVVDQSLHSPIGYRIQSLPFRPINYFVGTALGNIATVFLQIIMLIVFFKFIFRADFGSDLGFVLLLCFLLAFIVMLFSMAVSLFFSEQTADGMLNFIVPIATFLAGGYVQLSFLETNPVTAAIRGFLPNSIVQNLIFQNIYGGGGISVIGGLLKLAAAAILGLLLVAVGLRRGKYGYLSK